MTAYSNHHADAFIQRWFLSFWLMLCLIVWSVFAGANPLSVEKWREDLEVYEHELKSRHIDLFHTINEQDFSHSLEEIRHSLPDLSEWELITRLMKLTRRIGDGHTAVPLWGQRSAQIPVKFEYIDSKFIVTEASEKYQALLGHEFVSVNKVNVAKIADTFGKIAPFVENAFSEKVRVAHLLSNASVFHGTSVIAEGQNLEGKFTSPANKAVRVTLPVLPPETISSVTWSKLIPEFSNRHFVENQQLTMEKYIKVGFSPKTQTVYLGIISYPGFDGMMNFCEKLYGYLSQASVKNIIIDLRESYGGDLYMGMLLSSFLNQLDSVNWRSGVFVLTSHKTFSAAMVNARQFWRLLNATIYGEPTGAAPNGYQDMGRFRLPNSKLLITYSKRRFRIEDKEAEAVQPDVVISPSLSDIRSGNDRVLNTVMRKMSN